MPAATFEMSRGFGAKRDNAEKNVRQVAYAACLELHHEHLEKNQYIGLPSAQGRKDEVLVSWYLPDHIGSITASKPLPPEPFLYYKAAEILVTLDSGTGWVERL